MDEKLIKRAEELERMAAKLRKDAARKPPDFWRVGQKVRYLENSEWCWSEGDTAFVLELRDKKEKIPAYEYQVFYTGEKEGSSRYWTTPDDVELVQDAK